MILQNYAVLRNKCQVFILEIDDQILIIVIEYKGGILYMLYCVQYLVKLSHWKPVEDLNG